LWYVQMSKVRHSLFSVKQPGVRCLDIKKYKTCYTYTLIYDVSVVQCSVGNFGRRKEKVPKRRKRGKNVICKAGGREVINLIS
jgi:hypothetical protein